MEKLRIAIIAVFKEIERMSDAEFQSHLDNHANGDIANALLEIGAFEQHEPKPTIY